MPSGEKQYSFVQKIWIAGGILALITILLLLIKATFSVLLLVLAAVMVATFFRGVSGFLHRKTGWNNKLCLTLSVASTFVLLGLFFWLMGAKVQEQMVKLSEILPSTIQNARSRINQSPMGQKILQQASSPETMDKAKGLLSTIFSSTFGILGDMYVILFIGIFFTVSPFQYKSGIVKLVPEAGKDKANDVLNKVGANLKKWLKGKLFAMLVVAVLTGIGLAVIGVPMWLVLALIAGLLNFIPNFGPLIAMVPAVLIALMQGPATAGMVAGLYILVQVLESNFITPVVQKKLVQVPPALIIIAQVLIAPLTGVWGIILATPLLVIVMVLVKQLYINRKYVG
ncbi:putative PurR-regulated permease PerM [Anseongella ginsenosidimutans]|uniref:Putative PurR-regulated permease PerM n=2 Tax=Anseongella ginsenosidimutans TaxID=496056 RepID=A0A4V2UTK4_9SPHI|nr:putative PurR-regulated permease PerM [Anseongella ginsenosidimutans]